MYRIISPLPENALETPSTGDSDGVGMQQTFPETPSGFSPFWSPGPSPGMSQGLPDGYEFTPMPQTPLSAALPGSGRGAPVSLDQQILLTRAASMARTRHSRQGSLPMFGTESRELPKPQAPASTSAAANSVKPNDDREVDGVGEESSAQVVQAPPSRPSETSPVSSASQYSEPSVDPHPLYEETRPGPPAVEVAGRTRPASPSTLESSPQLAYLVRNDSSRSTQSSPSVTPLPSNLPSSHHLDPAPEFADPFNSRVTPPPRFEHRTVSPHHRSLQTPPPVVITPPAGDSASAPSPYLGHSLRRISEISNNFDSPPPYDTIDQDQPPPPSLTPNSGNSHVEPHFAARAHPSPPATQGSSSEHLPLSRKTSDGNRDRRGRVRPVAPTGPRRPLSHLNSQPVGRTRNPSISSVSSTPPNSNPTTTVIRTASTTPVVEPKSLNINPSTPNAQPEPSLSPSNGTATAVNNTPAVVSPQSPDFQVPPMQYRGLTLDQAKWTFTSAQLQTVVSRAIQQSAEASSIRLLRLETLDNDIPRELKRLEAQKAEIKGKYRSLTRASESLFMKLNNQIANGSTSTQRTLEELRDVTGQLNHLTEELHSVDQQHAQIQSLVLTHSASALSMALRKLNASFLKQLAETQELQRQVADLENEIWTINELRKTSPEGQLGQSQAKSQSHPPAQSSSSQQVVPNLNLSEPAANSGAELESKRSTHSVAVARRPSLGYSRTVRLSGNRLSQRSSSSSNGARTSLMLGGGMSGTNPTFGVPPVPPLPRRRPTDILTDAPASRTTVRILLH